MIAFKNYVEFRNNRTSSTDSMPMGSIKWFDIFLYLITKQSTHERKNKQFQCEVAKFNDKLPMDANKFIYIHSKEYDSFGTIPLQIKWSWQSQQFCVVMCVCVFVGVCARH